MVVFVLILVAIPMLCWFAEMEFRDRMVAFNEVEDHIQSTDNCGYSASNLSDCLSGIQAYSGSKWPVHVRSKEGDLTASTQDQDFGVSVDNALVLHRNTEYCQWQEFSTEKCDTCHRNENGKSVSYSCHCRTTYHYVKAWRSHRINSLLFNQVLIFKIISTTCLPIIVDPRHRSLLRTTTLSATPSPPPSSPRATPASPASRCAPPSSPTRTPRCAPPSTPWTGRAARGASRGGTTGSCAGPASPPASPRGTRRWPPWRATGTRRRRRGSGSRTWGGGGTSSRRTRRSGTSCSSSTLSR